MMDEALSSDARILKPEGSQASGSATDRDLSDLRTAIAHLTEERDKWYRVCDEAWTAVDKTVLAEPDEFLAVGICQLRERAEQAEAQLAALTEVHERLKGLSERCRESARLAAANASNEQIRPLDRRQCFGVSQAYSQCADELDALLSPREGTPQEPHE